MNQDDIIDKLARKAGVVIDANQSGFDDLMHFATLVAAAEREECARICDERGEGWLEVRNARTIDEGCMHSAAKAEATALAAAIRERGAK